MLRRSLNHRSTNIPIGMYVPPSITLANFAGAALRLYCIQKLRISEATLMCAATGCILSEGTLSFIPLIMASMGIPRLL